MHFPRYWVSASATVAGNRGEEHSAQCWGWSDRSEDDARARAVQKAERVAQLFAQGTPPKDRYLYGDGRPLREEVIETLGGPGEIAITRNSYGCLIMNASQVMFVDIDLPDLAMGQGKTNRGSGGGLMGRLFGRKPDPRADDLPEPAAAALDRADEWCRRNGSWGFRCYLTAAGLRLLETTRLHDPKSSETLSILQGLGADPLFVKLCNAQESFRARLTPKPWRIGWYPPGISWPYEASHALDAMRKWQGDYDKRAESYATCRFVRQIGAQSPEREIVAVADYHDRETRAESGLPLA